MYVQEEPEMFNMQDARHPTLDSEITVEEIKNILKNLKSKKAPGLDGIPYEFYKNLPDEGLDF